MSAEDCRFSARQAESGPRPASSRGNEFGVQGTERPGKRTSVSGMEKARIALIGAGWWGVEIYLPELEGNPDIDLVGINRRDRASLDRILAKYPNCRGYTDYREMLEKEGPDAVVVTSPHTAHFEHGRRSLEAGCHVLIDKPMATSAEDARTLVESRRGDGKRNSRSVRMELQGIRDDRFEG